MSEWLTTGQMLDELETGQVAECMESPLYEWIGTKIEHRGLELRWTAKSGKHEEFYVSTNVQKNKWRILPNYVSFEEAMKALKEGKTVSVHIDGEIHTVTHYEADTYRLSAMKIEQYGLIPLMKADWTIEADTP